MNYKNKSQTRKVSFKAFVVLMLVLGTSLMAAPVMGAEGDVQVQSEDVNGDYEGDVVLYEASDSQVDSITADDGIATFEELQHGDYYLSAQDATGSTVQSETFTHDADETIIEHDIEDNSITVSENEDLLEPESPSADNIVDTANDGNVTGFIPIGIGALLVLAVFGGAGFLGIMLISFLRR